MHELGIAMRIVDIASGVAEQNGVHTVDVVNVDVGTLTGVVPEALQFAFESAIKNSRVENARLHIHLIKGKAVCNICRQKFNPEGVFIVCPACNSNDCDIINGKELFVQSIIPGE